VGGGGHDSWVIGGPRRALKASIDRDSAVNRAIEEILGPIRSLRRGRRCPDGQNPLPPRRMEVGADPRHALGEGDGRQPQAMVPARPLDDDGISRSEWKGSLAHRQKNRVPEAKRYRSRDFPHATSIGRVAEALDPVTD